MDGPARPPGGWMWGTGPSLMVRSRPAQPDEPSVTVVVLVLPSRR